jgi:hypothetical protein
VTDELEWGEVYCPRLGGLKNCQPIFFGNEAEAAAPVRNAVIWNVERVGETLPPAELLCDSLRLVRFGHFAPLIVVEEVRILSVEAEKRAASFPMASVIQTD